RGPLAADALGNHAAEYPHDGCEEGKAEPTERRCRLHVHMVQTDPISREPGSQCEEAAEGHEVKGDEAPGARVFSGGNDRLPDAFVRKELLTFLGGDPSAVLRVEALLAQLEEIGVSGKPRVDCDPDQKKREPSEIGAGQSPA